MSTIPVRQSRSLFAVAVLTALAACTAARSATAPAAMPVDEGDWQHPGGTFAMRVGVGESEAIRRLPRGNPVTPSTLSQDETTALWYGLGFEGVGDDIGGGVTFDLYVSDDNQLENNDSVDSALLGMQLFPHFTIRPKAPHFRIPIRIGPAIETHILADDRVGPDSTTDFVSIAGQVEIEPEVDFLRQRGGMALSVFGKVRGSVGAAFISTTPEDYETDVSGVGFEAGLRFQAAVFQIETAYVYRQSTYDANTTLPETEFSFTGFVFGIGVRW